MTPLGTIRIIMIRFEHFHKTCIALLISLFLSMMTSSLALAQQPSCVVRPSVELPFFWQYCFGDCKSSGTICDLQSGQGVQLQFDRTPGSTSGITTHLSINLANSNRPPLESLTWTDAEPNTMYRMDRRTYEQSQPTLQKIPDWAAQIIDQNQAIFKRHMPVGYTAWEKTSAERIPRDDPKVFGRSARGG